jgi:esterase/lipase superfamily enzyme
MRIAGKGLLWVVVASVVASPCWAWAATLVSFNVVADGSVDPPGDRIDVAVLFDPGEDEVVLETRAYALLQGSADQVVPVEAGDAGARNPHGHFQSTVMLKRPADSRLRAGPIVIPYASLKLPPGRHQIGYEIRGLRGGQVEFVQPTPMTAVIVSERTRHEIRQAEEKTENQLSRRPMTAYVLKEGAALPQEIEVESEQAIRTHEVRTARVEIPGEFLRPRPVATRGIPTTGQATPGRAAMVPLEGHAWAPLSAFEAKPKRTVYYATNRGVVSPETLAPSRFGAEASPTLTYGSCLVNIPIENHTRGQLEVPSYWWQSRDPSKYFLVESLELLTRDQWQKQVAPDDVLLFIHGYNTDFQSAVLRSGQLVHDLKFPGKALAFSWPSAGALAKYAADEEQAEKSIAALADLFRQFSAPVAPRGAGQARKLHVIVHSMGNRVFLGAVRRHELESPGKPAQKLFGHVALAAPDVDAATFAALLPSLLRQSDTATLYYCQSDRALLASQTVHLNKPVGLGPFFADGLDTINCDNASTSLLGHDYYASTHPLLIDLRLTINFGEKPDERFPPLGHRQLYLGYPHWSFLPPR